MPRTCPPTRRGIGRCWPARPDRACASARSSATAPCAWERLRRTAATRRDRSSCGSPANLAGGALEAHDDDGGGVRRIPLAHETADPAAPVFSAAAAATAVAGGRLHMRWARHAWSADFRFEVLPRPAGTLAGDPDADAVQSDIAFDNESSTPEVRAVQHARRTQRDRGGAGRRVANRRDVLQGLDVEDEDYGRLAGTAAGNVVQWVRAAPPRLQTDVDLRFGRTALPTGNLAAGFAGMYAVWLRKVDVRMASGLQRRGGFVGHAIRPGVRRARSLPSTREPPGHSGRSA